MMQPIEQAKRLREMLDNVECPKGHGCALSGFRDLCRAEDVFGSGRQLICLEDPGALCGYQVSSGEWTLCNCPVRFYLHMELGV